MADAIGWVGLDVHATQTTIAVLDQVTGELSRAKLRGSPEQVVPGFLAGFDGRVIGVYEAGPTGMRLARTARAMGIDLRVCAPGLIARKPTDRIKTDARDAERLAQIAPRCDGSGRSRNTPPVMVCGDDRRPPSHARGSSKPTSSLKRERNVVAAKLTGPPARTVR